MSRTRSNMKPETIRKLLKIAGRWDWENYQDEDGKEWTILQALYCKLSWVLEHLEGTDDSELSDIVQDTMDIVEVLQKEITI